MEQGSGPSVFWVCWPGCNCRVILMDYNWTGGIPSSHKLIFQQWQTMVKLAPKSNQDTEENASWKSVLSFEITSLKDYAYGDLIQFIRIWSENYCSSVLFLLIIAFIFPSFKLFCKVFGEGTVIYISIKYLQLVIFRTHIFIISFFQHLFQLSYLYNKWKKKKLIKWN